jgi:imidazoleglycerol-phosphate dehydratase
MNLHVGLLYGDNAHHQAEAIFKSFGRALRSAIAITQGQEIPSTKGVL